MVEDRRIKVKVGVLLAAALIGIIALIALMDGFTSQGEPLEVDLTHSGGIPAGAPVRMAGIKIGRVKEVKLIPDRVDEQNRPLAVHMRLEIQKDVFVHLHEGVTVDFATQGPLGETYLELSQGDLSGPLLKPGTVLRAYPQRLEFLIPKLLDLITTIQSMAGEIENGEVRTLLSELRAAASGARSFFDDQGPVIGEMIQRLSRASASLEKMAARGEIMLAKNGDLARTLKKLAAISAQLETEIPQVSKQARKTLDNLEKLSSSLTPEDIESLKSSLREAEAASKRLDAMIDSADKLLSDADRLVTNADQIASGIRDGKGTLGAMLKDETLFEDLRALITDLKAHPWRLLWKN